MPLPSTDMIDSKSGYLGCQFSSCVIRSLAAISTAGSLRGAVEPLLGSHVR